MPIMLKTFCYVILQITLLLSILFLLRGHNHPGGGFIAALIATTGIGFYILVNRTVPDCLKQQHRRIIFSGLACLIASATLALCFHKNLLTGLWWTIKLPLQTIKLGTPLLFDIGIYLAILGSLLWVITKIASIQHD